MNAPVEPLVSTSLRLESQIEAAVSRIAPTWPLDRFIAVNPYWGWIDRPMPAAAAALGTLAGTRLTLPRSWFEAQWAAGHLERRHLQAAIGAANDGTDATTGTGLDDVLAALRRNSPSVVRLPLITDLRDSGVPPRPGQRWTDLVTHQTSQHCAAFFDHHQATWGMETAPGLYDAWRQQLGADHGVPWHHPRTWLRARLAALPAAPPALIADALDALGIPEEGREAYLGAVLMSVGGWAAWCAYERWQARSNGANDVRIVHLLAIRMAWEWLLHDDAPPGALPADWAARWRTADAAARELQQAQRMDWLLQSAAEIAYQEPLIARLSEPVPAELVIPPAVQAVFCIDVRSEVFRRALESASPAVQTRGFAGFFGLPIAYSPIGSALTRPQLPGLLAPVMCVTERTTERARRPDSPRHHDGAGLGQVLAGRRRSALQSRRRWAEFRAAPVSAFTFVETLGLLYGAKLLVDSLPSSRTPPRWEDAGLPAAAAARLRPGLPHLDDDPAAAAVMARDILRAMGLTDGFAPLVLLAGHGSQSANNPHAAGLDCGACGGQTGEVNARVLADLLNHRAVRGHLRHFGIDIPDGTHFVPALHNTTTDEVRLFDTDALPRDLEDAVAVLKGWLEAAGHLARAERAGSLGMATLRQQPAALKQALRRRANDWAQLRPEWGLANNAAFIAAPRARTRHLNLEGRCFLHDYDSRADPDGSRLATIMTAPMVVAHWINMQYHASTVDNRRYGSGNKTLHNVVGGRIGVFEGNGGDLRIGLPQQSLHDGQTLRHTPLRLSVFIEAPREAIDRVIAEHETVANLVGNGWLHLLRIATDGPQVERWQAHEWVPTGAGGSAPEPHRSDRAAT